MLHLSLYHLCRSRDSAFFPQNHISSAVYRLGLTLYLAFGSLCLPLVCCFSDGLAYVGWSIQLQQRMNPCITWTAPPCYMFVFLSHLDPDDLPAPIWSSGSRTQARVFLYLSLCWNICQFLSLCWNMFQFLSLCWRIISVSVMALKHISVCHCVETYFSFCHCVEAHFSFCHCVETNFSVCHHVEEHFSVCHCVEAYFSVCHCVKTYFSACHCVRKYFSFCHC